MQENWEVLGLLGFFALPSSMKHDIIFGEKSAIHQLLPCFNLKAKLSS